MIQRIVIPAHELGFLYRDGDFRRLLRPGVHWLLDWRPLEVRRASRLAPRLAFPDIELLVRRPEVAAEVLVHHVGDDQRGLLRREGNFAGFLPPGFHAHLITPIELEVELVDITEVEVTHPLRDVMAAYPGADPYLEVVEVPDRHQGILYLDGVKEKVLEPGRHMFWKGLRKVRAVVLDLREQTLEIQGQELMTADKVSLRVNLSVRHRVADPELATGTQANYSAALYRDLQLALRDEIGAHTLDELLARKEDVGAAVAAKVAPLAEAFGVRIEAAGLRDVILPGEMRTILNQVIEAEKRAQANMITRREETAATRSLLNTVKLLEQNPLLLHLKELESVERISEKIGSLSVYGGLEGLMSALKGFVRGEGSAPARDP